MLELLKAVGHADEEITRWAMHSCFDGLHGRPQERSQPSQATGT